MLNKKEFKMLLTEWQTLLYENRVIPLAELLDIINSNSNYTESDAQNFADFWNSNQFSSKYSQVIKNDLEKGEPIEHITDAVIAHYHKVYQSAGPQIRSNIGNGTYSVDDLRKDLDDRLGANKFNKTELRQQCPYQDGRPVVGKYHDFDVIYSESDWIVIEPKTILGSIAWAHGKPDGSEETIKDRRSGWCTGVTSSNNMFPSYAGNLHMFYLIKSDYDSVSGPERRLCLSYIVNEGKARLKIGDATVNADNDPIGEEYINIYVNSNILSQLESMVSTRKNTSFEEIYSKTTYTQFKRLLGQMKSQGVDDESIERELKLYAVYTKDLDISKFLTNHYFEAVKISLSQREDLLEIDPTGELIRKLVNDEKGAVRFRIAQSKDILDVDPSGNLIKHLANDESSTVRQGVAMNKNLVKFDPKGSLLLQLANDEAYGVKSAIVEREDLIDLESPADTLSKIIDISNNALVRRIIAVRKDLLEIDPTGDLIRKLAADDDHIVRKCIAQRKDLLEADTSDKLIMLLASDEDSSVRGAIAKREDLIYVDPEGKLVSQLASDEDKYVVRIIASRKDLLELDPSGEIIRQLASDEDSGVRYFVSDNYNIDSNNNSLITNESTLRQYIRLIVR